MKHTKLPPIKIFVGVFEHGNGCSPSADQLVVDRKRSGFYKKQYRCELRSVYIHLTSSTPVSTCDLRAMLSKLLPSRVLWSAKDLWNVRVTARRYRHHLYSQEAFDSEVVPNLTVIRKPSSNADLDNNTDDVLDPALQMSQDLFYETLRESVSHEYNRFLVQKFLVKLSAADPGFKYKVFRSNDGAPTGYVYQTTYMRRSLEQFGNFLSLDMMKRRQNE